MMHLFNLVDIDSLQPVSDVPSPGRMWPNVVVSTLPSSRCLKVQVVHFSSAYRLSFEFAIDLICWNFA